MKRASVHWRTSSDNEMYMQWESLGGESHGGKRGNEEYYILNDEYYKCIDPRHSTNCKHKNMKKLY